MNVIYNTKATVHIKKKQVNKIRDIMWHCHMNALWDMYNLIGQILNRLFYLTIKTLEIIFSPFNFTAFLTMQTHRDSWKAEVTRKPSQSLTFSLRFFSNQTAISCNGSHQSIPNYPPLLKAGHLPLPNRKIDRTCTAPISSFW